MWNKRVLVTGGAGFIDSNLGNRLASDNDMIAVDDTYLSTPENLDDLVEFVEASVVDSELPVGVEPPPRSSAAATRTVRGSPCACSGRTRPS